jgi:translation initiation factor 1A
MPKNTGMGGNKRKKGKKMTQQERELVFKGESEEYGQVVRLLGDARMEIQCCDGVKRIGHIRGKMRKRNWIANGDVILVSIRDYEPEKCDVIDKYTEDEIRKLKKAGEIPESITLPDSEKEKKERNDDNYNDIVFEDDLPGSDDEKEDDVKPKKKDKKKKNESDDEDDEKDVDIDNI